MLEGKRKPKSGLGPLEASLWQPLSGPGAGDSSCLHSFATGVAGDCALGWDWVEAGSEFLRGDKGAVERMRLRTGLSHRRFLSGKGQGTLLFFLFLKVRHPPQTKHCIAWGSHAHVSEAAGGGALAHSSWEPLAGGCMEAIQRLPDVCVGFTSTHSFRKSEPTALYF